MSSWPRAPESSADGPALIMGVAGFVKPAGTQKPPRDEDPRQGRPPPLRTRHAVAHARAALSLAPSCRGGRSFNALSCKHVESGRSRMTSLIFGGNARSGGCGQVATDTDPPRGHTKITAADL